MASDTFVLKKGPARTSFRLRALSDAEKPAVLKAYLEAFKTEVQRYFIVPAGSPAEAFQAVTRDYLVFELQPV